MKEPLLRWLACLLLAFFSGTAWAKAPAKAAAPPQPETIELDADEEPAPPAKGAAKGAPKTAPAKAAPPAAAPAPAPAPAAAPAAAAPPPQKVDIEDDDEGDQSGASAGIECAPAISEVETRRTIPFSCAVTNDAVEDVELRYKAPGKKKWTKTRLRKSGEEFVGEIPCASLTKRGTLQLSIVGIDADEKNVARIGGVKIRLVDASNEPPPALPGREPSMRCYEPNDCPNELKGSPACPGTKAVGGLKSWGAACERSKECSTGLACISGTCDKPAKCETAADCGGNDCESGSCTYPDPEELASRLGPPKLNWIGLHFGADFAFSRAGSAVCSREGGASGDYTCYNGSTEYTGTPNTANGNAVPGGIGLATMRVMASFERWFNRVAIGARLGFAFAGAPKDFLPVHIEARVLYAMRRDPLNKRFRPYVGLDGGLGQVDTHHKVKIADCLEPRNPMEATRQQCIDSPYGQGVVGNAVPLPLDAFGTGSKFFFGPTAGFYYAFTNDQGLNVNLNLMLPDMVIEPSVGYVMGL